MKRLFRHYNEKGQGIVEYALLIGFAAALVFAIDVFNFTGILGEAFDETVFKEVTRIDTVEMDQYIAALQEWGTKDKSEFTSETSDKRLQADQKGLENLGRFFLGQSKTVIQKALHISDDKIGMINSGSELLITRFDQNLNTNQQGMYYYQRLNEGENAASNNKDKTDGRVFNWLRGDYGSVDPNTNLITGYDDNITANHIQGANNKYYTDTRAFVSDYTVFNNKSTDGKTGSSTGIKIKLWYDSTGTTVTKVQVRVDPGSNNTSSTYNGHSNSRGLDVTLQAGNDGSVTVTKQGVK